MGLKSLSTYHKGNHNKYINFWPWLSQCKQKLMPVFPSLQCHLASLLCWGFSFMPASWEDVISPHAPPISVFAVDHAFLQQISGCSPDWKASHWVLRPMEKGRTSLVESEEKEMLHLKLPQLFSLPILFHGYVKNQVLLHDFWGFWKLLNSFGNFRSLKRILEVSL